MPAPPAAPDVLVFEHIPKTAGTTFRQVLRRRYGPDLATHFSVANPANRLQNLVARFESARPPRALISTIGYGLHERLPGGRRTAHFTLLRDPIQRTISNYYYSLQIGEIAEDVTLVAFCSGDPATVGPDRASNRQTAFLASRSWNYQTGFLGGLRVRQLLDGRPFDPADYDAALLERAKANLDTFLVPGLVARFDETLLLLGHALGWPLRTLRFVKTNRGQRRPKRLDLTPEERAALEAANTLDLALYRHAEERFAQLLAERLPDLPERLRAMERMNRVFRPLMPIEHRIERLRSRARQARRARSDS
jgi:hypothetical protein